MNRRIFTSAALSFATMTGTAFADLFYVTPGTTLSQDFNTLAVVGGDREIPIPQQQRLSLSTIVSRRS